MKKITLFLLLINFILLNQNAVFGEISKLTQEEEQEYKLVWKCVESTNTFLSKSAQTI